SPRRGRIPAHRLVDDLVGGEEVEVPPDELRMFPRGDDEDLPGLEEGKEPLDRLPHERGPAEKRERLLGPGPAGERPEARPAPARHHHRVEVFHRRADYISAPETGRPLPPHRAETNGL